MDSFDVFWDRYHMRKGQGMGSKRMARSYWEGDKLTDAGKIEAWMHDEILRGVELYREMLNREDQQWRQPADAFRWLRRARWEEFVGELTEPKPNLTVVGEKR